MSYTALYRAGYSGTTPADNAMVMARKLQSASAGPALIAAHGHAAGAEQYQQAVVGPGLAARSVVEAGYRLYSNDAVSLTHWGNAAAETSIGDLVTYAQGTGGAKSGKVVLLGWSMGCLPLLNYMKNNPAKVAAAVLVAPVTDLAWAQVQAPWTAEVNAAYGGNFAGNAAGRDPALFAASLRGIAPIAVYHATDDATVPITQSQTFVSAVASADVTLTTIASGGHTGLWSGIDLTALVAFLRRLLAPS